MMRTTRRSQAVPLYAWTDRPIPLRRRWRIDRLSWGDFAALVGFVGFVWWLAGQVGGQ